MRKRLAIDLSFTQPCRFSNPVVKLGHFLPLVKYEAHKIWNFRTNQFACVGKEFVNDYETNLDKWIPEDVLYIIAFTNSFAWCVSEFILYYVLNLYYPTIVTD